MSKPVFFADLDDTLFQTRRKMQDELGETPFRCAALDRSLAPRSFMTQEQAMMVDWLLEHAELIPVTARGTEETARVQIPFHSWRVMTHGAVILTPQGEADAAWQAHMLAGLAPYRERLLSMESGINALMAQRGINAWARLNYEYDGTPVYMVMKHRDSTQTAELYALADELKAQFPTEGFYFHRNGNNVAWLPDCVEKGQAVIWLLEKLRAQRGVFPVMGLGDSLSDYRFMRHCTWFGIPRRSQFSHFITEHLYGKESDD
ncbi:hypothetical protein [Enterobacillus tribolii]|uniref:Hydroxymethylpyrimidine pyrophosphatase-like HAD family hydrolase n=1 Tax=Enterobacillus tribolii TaxID=1487935 RepID=A0A370R1J6_9GAMM|nr:hypothetical protein [Enterobacillus tribolii]MBW7983093.1 hypothetical protein [Enterobacillus tribolii]RDK95803.1 hypothetical protein C8D90_102286 [Enterobacillus tribolii]